MRYVLAFLGLLVAGAAVAQPISPPPKSGLPGRQFTYSQPAYLAVNDPTLAALGLSPVKGDGMKRPATYMMTSGSAVLHMAHTAQILVSLTSNTGSAVLTLSPCIARSDWIGAGTAYRVIVFGAGAGSTITANAASSNTNIIHVASGGTAVPLYAPVTDSTTAGNIPAGTYVTATTATTITTNNLMNVASSDVIAYAAAKNAGIAAVNANGCTVTMDSNPTTAVTANLQYLVFSPSLNNAGTLTTTAADATWEEYRYDNCGIAKGSTSLVCPASTFINSGNLRQATQGSSLASRGGLVSVVAVHDQTGACSVDLVARILSVDTTGATATLDRPAPCAVTAGNFSNVYWGSTLLSQAYNAGQPLQVNGINAPLTISAGMAIDVPGAGSGSTATQPVDLVTTVSSVSDYFTGTLATTSSFTLSPSPYGAYLRAGTDDTAATLAACGYASGTSANATTGPVANATASYRGCYWPPGVFTFMASAGFGGGSIDGLLGTTRCGEGNIIWPLSANWQLHTSDCANGPEPYDEAQGFGGQDLKQARAQASTNKTVNVALWCDSWCVPGINSVADSGNLDGVFRDIIWRQNRALATGITVHNFSIGGAVMGWYDPNGPTYGNGSGIPSVAAGSRPDFYTTAGNTWLSYLQNSATPYDLLVMRVGFNDGYNFLFESLENVINTTQGATWKAAATRNPDIRLVPGSNAPQQQVTLGSWRGGVAVAGLQRSLVDSGWFNSVMANGGTLGLVDADAWQHRLAEGWDPVNIPSAPAQEILPPAPANLTGGGWSFPFTWTEPVAGYGAQYQIRQSGVLSNATFWSNIGNGICHAVGNGQATTPWSSGTQTGAHVAYSGGAFCVDFVPGTTHLNIYRYLYRNVQTQSCAMANSGAGGVGVLTCTAALANQGFELAQVYVAGAGVATCPNFMGGGSNCLSTTIQAGGVSSDGKTITLAVAAGVTFTTQSTKVMLYRLQPGDPIDTGCTPTLVTSTVSMENVKMFVHANGHVGFSEGVNGQFQEQGKYCQWDGVMAGFFGDLYYPGIFTEDNTAHTFLLLQTNSTPGFVGAWEETPDNSRLTPQYTTIEDSGMCPNYSGLFGGACYGHPGSSGIFGIYKRAFENAGWSFLP